MTENALFETLRFPARKGSLGDHADVDGVIPEPPVNKRPPVQPIVVPKIAKLPIREPTKLTPKTPDYDLESIWALYNQQKEILYFLIGNPRSHLQTDLHIDQKSQAYQDLIDLSLYQLSQIGKLQDSIVDVQTHDNLSAYVQKVINFNQNPKECRNREVNVCELSKGCGFACQMHHLLYCLSVSLGDGRPLLISSSSWHGFDSLYDLIQPLSVSCSLEKAESQNLTKNHIPIIESNAGNIFIPPSVPKHILDSIKKFHSFPLLWWLGQLVTYVYRLKPDVLEQIKVPEFVQPAIGIHVRRTDKIGTEALSYSVEEYMKWVDLYNRRLKIEGKVPIKNIYVATDEIGLIKEFKEK
ncbi:Alpha-(1,6)-fucosyltransferase [Thelohanellus kitauei]|uniref:Alpha-(1,6)-fucosyltransferase n=1 Tax=Thelohanellus kitauei TaxID=669202 RepID=A0A0C2JUK1_THEKT|nr:Alpha-(1,6)-fucosyltransferase [Thelohanellus kitauei]